jgi:hypothetical protein
MTQGSGHVHTIMSAPSAPLPRPRYFPPSARHFSTPLQPFPPPVLSLPSLLTPSFSLFLCSMSEGAASQSGEVGPTDLAASGQFDETAINGQGPSNGSSNGQGPSNGPPSNGQAIADPLVANGQGRKRKRRRKGVSAGVSGGEASYDSNEWRLARIPPSYYATKTALGAPVVGDKPSGGEKGQGQEEDEGHDVAMSVQRREVGYTEGEGGGRRQMGCFCCVIVWEGSGKAVCECL